MSDVGCRMSDVGCRMSDVGCRMSDVGCRMSDVLMPADHQDIRLAVSAQSVSPPRQKGAVLTAGVLFSAAISLGT